MFCKLLLKRFDLLTRRRVRRYRWLKTKWKYRPDWPADWCWHNCRRSSKCWTRSSGWTSRRPTRVKRAMVKTAAPIPCCWNVFRKKYSSVVHNKRRKQGEENVHGLCTTLVYSVHTLVVSRTGLLLVAVLASGIYPLKEETRPQSTPVPSTGWWVAVGFSKTALLTNEHRVESSRFWVQYYSIID